MSSRRCPSPGIKQNASSVRVTAPYYGAAHAEIFWQKMSLSGEFAQLPRTGANPTTFDFTAMYNASVVES
jgi:hypothetical protein